VSDADSAFFFEHAGHRLYAYLHVPVITGKKTGCVLVHPLMEERQDAHPVLRDLADAMAEKGFATLRVDLHGCGDSSGEWEDATIEAWLNNIVGAAEQLRQRTGVESIVLAGLRFGATLAAMAASATRASAVVMVQPIVRGGGYIKDLLLASITSEMVLHRKAGTTRERLIEDLESGRTVNLFGYHFTPAQFRAIRDIDLVRDQVPAVPALVLDVVRTATAQGSVETRSYSEAMGNRVTFARVQEPSTLYVEGRTRIARVDAVREAVLSWMEALG
jgi:exosortase A-associated hydrolase 2